VASVRAYIKHSTDHSVKSITTNERPLHSHVAIVPPSSNLLHITSVWQVVMPESVECAVEKRPGGRFKRTAQKKKAYKVRYNHYFTSSCLCFCYEYVLSGKLQDTNIAFSFHLSTQPQLTICYLQPCIETHFKSIALLLLVVFRRRSCGRQQAPSLPRVAAMIQTARSTTFPWK
jgi:hypothetical protein